VNDWPLPDGLPPGRLIVPDPTYGSGVSTPVLWVSDAPVAQPVEDRFGARLLDVGFDTIALSVAAPPLTTEHALAVAAEHFALCPDNIWQGSHETFPAYAEALVDSDLWWD
jgi:hypothetical protein